MFRSTFYIGKEALIHQSQSRQFGEVFSGQNLVKGKWNFITLTNNVDSFILRLNSLIILMHIVLETNMYEIIKFVRIMMVLNNPNDVANNVFSCKLLVVKVVVCVQKLD